MKKALSRSDSAVSEDLSKKMGIGRLIAAAVFLFNPCINIIDILPDFFGYLLLISGLSKWADLCPNMMDALQGLGRLKWFMLLKMLMMVLVPLVDDTYVLVFTFGFAIIELMYLIPATERIFDGFEYFGTRFNSRSVYINYKNVRTITYIFFFARSLLPVLPELCSLSDFEYSGYVTSGVQINYANYKGALLIVGLILLTLIGTMWLVNIIPYFRRIGRDTEFLTRVSGQYDLEIANDIGLNFRRALHTVLLMAVAGMIFFINLWIDEFNAIPNFIGGAFLAASMVKLSRYTNSNRLAARICAVFTGVSAISYAASLLFTGFYGLDSIERNFTAYNFYIVTGILTLVEYILMLASVYLVFRELRLLIEKHLGADPDVIDRRLIDIYTSQQHELDRRFVAALIAFVVVWLLNLINLMLRADLVRDAPQFWIVPFLAAGIWWIYFKSICDQLYEHIEYKYL